MPLFIYPLAAMLALLLPVAVFTHEYVALKPSNRETLENLIRMVLAAIVLGIFTAAVAVLEFFVAFGRLIL